MSYVLDSSAIFSGHIPSGQCFITPQIESEIRDINSLKMLSSYISSGIVNVRESSKSSQNEVEITIARTGDSLSPADISVLALALDLKATVVTDDYGIQNTASELGLEAISAKTEGIDSRFEWGLKCTGCGKKYPSGKKMSCEICGSPLKKYIRRRSQRI